MNKKLRLKNNQGLYLKRPPAVIILEIISENGFMEYV